MIQGLIGSVILGLIVGALGARIVPGRTPGGKPTVFRVGIAGAILGDLLSNRWYYILLAALAASVIAFFVLDRVARSRESA